MCPRKERKKPTYLGGGNKKAFRRGDIQGIGDPGLPHTVDGNLKKKLSGKRWVSPRREGNMNRRAEKNKPAISLSPRTASITAGKVGRGSHVPTHWTK